MTYACFPFNPHIFGAKGENLRQNMWNLWEPLAMATINGHEFRVCEGYIRVGADGKKKKSYILYKDKILNIKFVDSASAELYVNSDIEGEFDSVQDAKAYAKLLGKESLILN